MFPMTWLLKNSPRRPGPGALAVAAATSTAGVQAGGGGRKNRAVPPATGGSEQLKETVEGILLGRDKLRFFSLSFFSFQWVNLTYMYLSTAAGWVQNFLGITSTLWKAL